MPQSRRERRQAERFRDAIPWDQFLAELEAPEQPKPIETRRKRRHLANLEQTREEAVAMESDRGWFRVEYADAKSMDLNSVTLPMVMRARAARRKQARDLAKNPGGQTCQF